MNILSRFMNWARGGSSQPEQVEVPTAAVEEVTSMPDFDNLTKQEIIDWVEAKYGTKLSKNSTKAVLVAKVQELTSETSSVA